MAASLFALVGSGEYLPAMEAVDRQLLAAAPRPAGGPVPVVCIPAAAGQEGRASVDRWLNLGLEHFTRLGAAPQAARIVDRASADDPAAAAVIAAAGLIYFSGGDPAYLRACLAGSRAWAAVETARARGAVVAGCSAGAMILARQLPDVRSARLDLQPGFGWVPARLILPHFDQLEGFRPGTTELVRSRLGDGEYALGIDEETALVGRPGAGWEVQGARTVVVLSRSAAQVFPSGQRLHLPGEAGPL